MVCLLWPNVSSPQDFQEAFDGLCSGDTALISRLFECPSLSLHRSSVFDHSNSVESDTMGSLWRRRKVKRGKKTRIIEGAGQTCGFCRSWNARMDVGRGWYDLNTFSSYWNMTRVPSCFQITNAVAAMEDSASSLLAADDADPLWQLPSRSERDQT